MSSASAMATGSASLRLELASSQHGPLRSPGLPGNLRPSPTACSSRRISLRKQRDRRCSQAFRGITSGPLPSDSMDPLRTSQPGDAAVTTGQDEVRALQALSARQAYTTPLDDLPAASNDIRGLEAPLGRAEILPPFGSGPETEVERLRKELYKTQMKLRQSETELELTKSRLKVMESERQGEQDGALTNRSEHSRVAAASTASAATQETSGSRAREGDSRALAVRPRASQQGSKALKTTGRIAGYPDSLKAFWYPVAFSNHVDATTMVPFDCFDEPWVIFRGADGKAGCVRDECAHRACPLSLGSVQDGRIVCAYHGWEFSAEGVCEKMPSTKCTHATVSTLPCIERDGMIWVWPSKDTVAPEESSPDFSIPHTLPPSSYAVHAELVMELPVEYGLLVENLLDLAHAPFTHTSTFARGWSVPSLVRFKTAAATVLQGHWDPYPIAMEFRPPCVVVSTIGLAKPGQLEGGQTAAECSQHLFQMHACIPSSPGKTRLLYRMGLDFAGWVKHVPFINNLWTYLAGQVLDEDLRLVIGQQDRMQRGANVWNHPVIYDKLGVGFRRWRNAVEEGRPGSRQM